MVIEAVLFGILQGIFEWLPISSQGNLVILMVGFFGLSVKEALNYAVFLHAGTLLAAVVYFRKEISVLLKHIPRYRIKGSTENDRVTTFLLVATVLTALIGYPIYKTIQTSNFSGEIFIALVGFALIATGLIQRFAKIKGHKEYKDISLTDSILIGAAQALAAIPGISRSGITTSTLLFRNIKAENALALSFLMSIPAVFVADIGLGLTEGLGTLELSSVLIGIFFSFVFGLLTIHVLIKLAEKIKFWKFCIVIGLFALVPLIFYI